MSSSVDADVLLLMFAMVIMVTASNSQVHHHQQECNVLQSTVSFTSPKTIEMEDGSRRRIFCSADVSVKKCEGFCTSRVSPSVVQYPGFKKNCSCCKETSLRNRLLTLEDCFEGDERVEGESATLYIREPADCACSNCEL